MPPKHLADVKLCFADGTKIEGIAELETIMDFIEEHQEYVRVVRCKDCKHSDAYNHCTRLSIWNKPEDFCSYAERREE